MSQNNVDLDVTNYTPEELFTILELNEEYATKEDVINNTDIFIQQFNNDENADMATFFQDIQFVLNDYIDSIENTQTEYEVKDGANDETDYEYSSATKQTSNWFQNQSLKQNDTNQSNKVTERKQKIDVYNNPHLPMKQEQLGVNNNFNVPVAQDTLNPNLENVTKRFICLDSRYRQASGQNGVSTDYTLDLSDPLVNAISLRLYSFQIPVGWYNIETYNCSFWLQFYDDNGQPILFTNLLQNWINISIPPGRYDSTTLVVALNTALTGQFDFSATAHPIPVTYNSTTGRITMYLDGGIYLVNPSLNLTINDKTFITFFSTNGSMGSNSVLLNYKNTLGYLMGYTEISILVLFNGNETDSLLNLSGPQYLILAIDDYNQNHINNGLIGITEYSNNLKLPSYYNPSMPAKYTAPTASAVQTSQVLQEDSTLLTAQKLDITYKSTKTVLPTAPRILTQAQIYSINQITKNNENNTTYKSAAPTTTDTFAIIPIKGNVGFGDVYTDFSGSVQDNKRTYFGPVRIDRLHIKLLDDKGNLLDLHGLDWSITLICENLYQY
jgi:hypothetical protein